MNFFMDESFVAGCLDNLTDRLSTFERFVDALDKIASSEFTKLYYIRDLHSLEFDGVLFADLLYAHCADGDYRDLILRFDMAIERSESEFIECGRSLDSGVIELARLGVGGCVTGLDYSAEGWWRSGKMCTVFDLTSFQLALRFLFNALEMQPEHLDRFSELMFPNIYFHADPSDLKRMGIGYREYSSAIICHLSYLNDFAILDFEENLPTQIIQLAASRGVEISPESANTHGNRRAMARRRIEINDSPLVCEWHTKFTFNRGRIHFHARPSVYHDDIKQVTGSKVIIGIIAEHLPT
ncbi:hypothetical protein T3A99_18875 [Pseudomonas sp. N-137]|uniref:hypothetical protein n=1 Tax=Pseudomonas sp. N-137 TaxID=3108452 RepID=UPI00248BC84E|nr:MULTISPECIES: hypothetical protein [unclassified Pseudomonas]MEA1030632.1 hypothetical protein [Pseudomonas sp. N-137]